MRLGNNFEIALDCHILGIQLKRFYKAKHRQSALDLNHFAVQPDIQSRAFRKFNLSLLYRIGIQSDKANMTIQIYCINGPNLNLLGKREPEIYGHQTLGDIEALLLNAAEPLKVAVSVLQSNSEGQIVDWLQEAREKADGVILNAAAYTHTSVAIHDALKTLNMPVIEVHISNPAARESFRQTNYVSPVVTGSIAGLGSLGYVLALQALANLILSN